MAGTDSRERVKKGQTEMLQEERQMENDRCELEDVGERQEEGGRGDTEQTSSQRRSVRLRADCDVLTTQKTGHFPHSTVELATNKCAINSERSAAGIRIID